jgi:DNA repair exonuclease SbcCD ATPase subunit
MAETRLIKQRSAFRGQLTRLQTFVSAFDENEGNIEEIRTRNEHLTSIWQKLEEIQDEIEIQELDTTAETTRAEIETMYFTLKSQMQAMLTKHENTSRSANNNGQKSTNWQQQCTGTSTRYSDSKFRMKL